MRGWKRREMDKGADVTGTETTVRRKEIVSEEEPGDEETGRWNKWMAAQEKECKKRR